MSSAPQSPGDKPPGDKLLRGKRYTGTAIHVTFDAPLCIHAAECVRGLPAVFDRQRRPWILPDAGQADAIAAVISRCPTGALHYERVDGGPPEAEPVKNSIHIRANGPYYVRGKLTIVTADGTIVMEDVRLALCRCGQSQNKPFCDNAHIAAGFTDAGALAAAEGDSAAAALSAAADEPPAEHGPLTIKLRTNGPLKLTGQFELRSADKQTVHYRDEAALCRCGGSANKPFCDGSHRINGFQA